MIVTEDFLALGLHNGLLNKTQMSLLGQDFPASEGWKSLVLGRELSLADTNLFIFLRGKFPLTVQKQIVKNYESVASFHKLKKEKPQILLKVVEKNKNIENISIYCDGACKGNPGKAGSGLAVYYANKQVELWYGEYTEEGTNNTAELQALYKALLIAKEHSASEVIIYSDSRYSIDAISIWAYSWKAKGWKKKKGEIKNLALIKVMHSLYEELKSRVSIAHVKGHSGVEGNELADRMAMLAIMEESQFYKCYRYDSIDSVLSLSEG
ncbi:Ribonuclease HI-related protein 2 [hydrothermal vent metagenome]|uniref:ribonuclease H n=1 Tax=hydrothermal vent metagenome TaxID=652676 RepID=A0A1W1CZS5_9ZZZZ